WVRDLEGAAFCWAGSWNLPAAIDGEAVDSGFVALFRGGEWVVEVQRVDTPPSWLAEIKGAALAGALNHLGRLIGFVVLAAPRAPLALDRETFDLLRIVGRQAAAHVAERQYAHAVHETRQLRDFGRRFAFAAHDLKNVAAQLSMIVQ